MTIIQLEIRSWRGISPGAIHTYGEISWDGLDEPEKLSRFMTQKEKAQYNKENAENGFPTLKAKKDQKTWGFEDESAVIRTATKRCLELFPDGDFIIIKADRCVLSARPVVHWHPQVETLAKRMNELSDALEEAEKENAPGSVLDEIDNEYDKLRKEIENARLETKQETENEVPRRGKNKVPAQAKD